MTICF